ncbi:MAG: RdgB/HAM1 family non-canonical purine NTP pyrophosphatase [SAR324 cluster bacterium]|nr:RdgB/HAM1 family non-canonical purine NTP pyrophosphatase [SAR324 cluster bacterium]MBF0349554.1 RdgB/HAM1 family non-canonical purine NTP pyrophosphatase [SAR324 cluster bacterium]
MLYFVTSNLNKLREMRELLGIPLENVALDLHEIQTTNLHELVRDKTQKAYSALQQPVLVEDTSLFFNAWNELPGVLIKWFEKNMGMQGLVQALSAFPDKSARAVCCLGYSEDGETMHVLEGTLEGTIVPPRGSNGFGWDCIFQPAGETRTMAEMTAEEKHRVSMRHIAATRFRHFLKRQEAQK